VEGIRALDRVGDRIGRLREGQSGHAHAGKQDHRSGQHQPERNASDDLVVLGDGNAYCDDAEPEDDDGRVDH